MRNIILLITIAVFTAACQKTTILEADTYTRTINGHRYILADNGEGSGVSIIHDLSCPAPDSTHIQIVKIVCR
jgi:hypothetical protein